MYLLDPLQYGRVHSEKGTLGEDCQVRFMAEPEILEALIFTGLGMKQAGTTLQAPSSANLPENSTQVNTAGKYTANSTLLTFNCNVFDPVSLVCIASFKRGDFAPVTHWNNAPARVIASVDLGGVFSTLLP